MRIAWLLALALAGCGADGGKTTTGPTIVPVTITGPGGAHVFQAELARTPAEQERGLMYRTDLKPDGGMLFAPYPATGGPPKVATFWMKNHTDAARPHLHPRGRDDRAHRREYVAVFRSDGVVRRTGRRGA